MQMSKILSKAIAYKAYIITSVFILAADQMLKVIIRTASNLPIKLTSFASIVYIKNTGIAFGLLKDTNLVIIVAICAILGILFYFRKELFTTTLSRYALALIVGGAIGNLIDRILYGAVTDYIQIGFWPVFNLADSAITIGICLLIYTSLIQEQKKTKKAN